MPRTAEENRIIPRVNGHLREADNLADVLEQHDSVPYMKMPEFFLQKAAIKTQMGLLMEARRANDLAELGILLKTLNIGPEEMLKKGVLERLNPRMVELLDGILNG